MAKGAPSPAARQALARRVADLLAEYDLDALHRGIPEGVAAELWQAVKQDATVIDDTSVCVALRGSSIDATRARILAEHLLREGPESAHLEIVPSWSLFLDALVMHAYRFHPDAFEARAARLPTWAQLGLALVKRRLGRSVPGPLAAEAALALAATFPAGGPFAEFVYIEGDREESLRVDNTDDLRRFAALVDAETAAGPAWSQALARAVDQNRWSTVASVAPVLREVPLQRLAELLAARPAPSDEQELARSSLRSRCRELAMVEALSLLRARGDSAEALVAAAEWADGSGAQSAYPVATLLVLVAASRAAGSATGAPTAAALERLVTLWAAVNHRELGDLLIAAARALPAETVHRWVERTLPITDAATILLAAHFECSLFERSLREGPPSSPAAIGRVGADAIAPILEALASPASDPARQARIRHGLVFAVGEAVRAGAGVDEALDLELLVAAFDGRPLERAEYCYTMQVAMERVLRALPVERRRAILQEARTVATMSVSAMLPSIEDDAELDEWLGPAIRDGHVTGWLFERLGVRAVLPLLAHAASSTQMAWVHDVAKRGLGPALFAQVADAFVPGSKWRVIEADFERAIAAMPGGPRVRVYLLEPTSMAYSAREGSRSRLGGPPLGIRKADIPRGSDESPLRHVLTLDLADVPELGARHPEAQAIALFCPGLESECDANDAEWVLIARGAAMPGGAGSSENGLAVRGFDVPAIVFEVPEHDLGREARAALGRVRAASGHIFGKPFWIHREPGGDGGFWMQVDDGLAGGFPFDALYLFADGEVVAEVL